MVMIARLPLIAACFLVATSPPFVNAGEAQPNRLNFGIVHVGAKVQGSVKIFVDPKDAKALKAKLDAPDFVKVDAIDQGTQEYGKGNTKGYCDVAVTIDTARGGEFSSPMVMTLGSHRVEVPVIAKIHPRKPNLPRVLVIDTPFQKYSTGDATTFDPWLKLVERGGFDVDYPEVRPGKPMLEGLDLATYDSILLGEKGIMRLGEPEIAALRKYAEAGGRIILTANAFFMGSVPKANQILLSYGLEIKDTEDHRNAGVIDVGPDQITPCPLTDGVKALSFHRPSPAICLDKDRTLVLVGSPKNPNEHFVAIALAGKGQIVSLGESLWWLWIGKADNALLLENLLRRRPKAD